MNRIFKHSRRADDRERGATAMLVAVSLMVLIGFAAIAVDSGIAYADRRQQQSAADVGALAALQFAKPSLPTTNCGALSGAARAACRGAEEALDVVEGTLPGRYPLASWQACTDPNKPAEYTRGSTISPCINFTRNLQKSRVVLPGTDVATTFARVIGFNSIRVGAFAEAGMEQDIVGGVMPFAVGPTGAGADQACFFAGDSPQLNADPCSSGAQGNYGKLDLRTYGNDNYGTPLDCSGGNASRMAINIVTGSDHPLRPWNTDPTKTPYPDTVVNDNTNCPIMSEQVNQVETWPGNAAGAISQGLFGGISTPTLEGRLLCKGPLSSNQTNEDYPLGPYRSTRCTNPNKVNNLHPETLDHSPLWDYIKPGANAEVAGGVCAPGGGPIKTRAEMATCLAGWKAWPGPHTTSLFTKDIATSPRFGAVPILDSNPGGGFGAYLITEFRPVYIETIYLGCSGPVTCSTVHSPGEASTPGGCPSPITPAASSCGWPGNGNKILEAITAFVLTLDMLPDELADKFPYQEGTIVYNLSR